MMANKLTPKQDKFARLYVELGNASEAYRRAYDVGKDTTDQVIWNEASKVLATHYVAVRVFQLQEAAAKRTLVTVQSITDELEEARLMGKDTEQSSAMTSASLGKAKIHGLLVDKSAVSIDGKLDTHWTVEVVSPNKPSK